MKALAGFIVRGRGQAILAASLGGIVAFLLPPLSRQPMRWSKRV